MIVKPFLSSHYSFEGKKSYEKVLLLLYRHWFVLLLKFIFFAFLAVLPFVLATMANETLIRTGLTSLFWFVVSVYFLVWWYGLFYAITMYLLDTWIVTDHRAIDSQQFGFFNRSVAELNLSKIQDISVSVRGPVETVLDFGDLEMQTAGAKDKFLFEQIPSPNRVKDQIIEAQNEYMRTHHGGELEIHQEHAGV